HYGTIVRRSVAMRAARGIVIAATLVWACTVLVGLVALLTPRPGVMFQSLARSVDFVQIGAFGLIPAAIALIAVFFVPRPVPLGIRIAGFLPAAICFLAVAIVTVGVTLSRMGIAASVGG